LDSWSTDKKEFEHSHEKFNPGIPIDRHGRYINQRSSLTQTDYQNYLWLFGGRRV